MPAPKVRALPRPEGGGELDMAAYYIRHGCPSATAMRAALDNPYIDELQFSVGLVGHGMPLNTPFAVTSSNACGVCGSQPTAWFQWTGPKLFLP